MTPYHLFRQGDAHFVYHLSAGRFIRISEAAYALLELRLRLPKKSAETEFLKRFPDGAGVLSEMAALEDDGFFEPADEPMLDEAEFEVELDKRLLSPRNSMMLSVASGCNLACRYCYCGVCRDQLPDKGLMPEATALRAVEKLFADADPKADVRITFFGGEPLLNKPVIRSVVERCNQMAAERGMKAGFSVTTNATLMDDATAKLIADNNFGLMVSLDGPQPLHDAQCPTRDGHGSFDKAAAGIRLLMDRELNITVRCTMAHPAPDAMALIRFFSNFGFSRIVLGTVRNPAFPSACDFTEADSLAFRRSMERDVIPWMLSEVAAGRTPAYDPFTEIAEFQGAKEHPDKVPPFRCGACHGAMAVAPDGTLYPCHRFVGMETWAIGKLDTGTDLEKCKSFWRRYRACIQGSCPSCWAYRVCGGPCPWEIARSDGTFAMYPPLCKDACIWIQHGVYYLSKKEAIVSKTGEKGQ